MITKLGTGYAKKAADWCAKLMRLNDEVVGERTEVTSGDETDSPP